MKSFGGETRIILASSGKVVLQSRFGVFAHRRTTHRATELPPPCQFVPKEKEGGVHVKNG